MRSGVSSTNRGLGAASRENVEEVERSSWERRWHLTLTAEPPHLCPGPGPASLSARSVALSHIFLLVRKSGFTCQKQTTPEERTHPCTVSQEHPNQGPEMLLSGEKPALRVRPWHAWYRRHGERTPALRGRHVCQGWGEDGHVVRPIRMRPSSCVSRSLFR